MALPFTEAREIERQANRVANDAIRNGRNALHTDGIITDLTGRYSDAVRNAYETRIEQQILQRLERGSVVERAFAKTQNIAAGGLRKGLGIAKGVKNFTLLAGAATAAAVILPNLKFGAKRGSANAEIDALREQAVASQEPQVLTAEQTMPMLPPMQAPVMGLPEGMAVGGDGASLMDQSPVPASKVAALGADTLPGGFMKKHNARQEMGAASPALS